MKQGICHVFGSCVSGVVSLFLILFVAPQFVAAQVIEQQWAARLDGPAHQADEANAVTTDAQGNTFVTGSVCLSAQGPAAPPRTCGNTQMLTTKYDVTGQQIWRAWLSSPAGIAIGRAITTDSSGNVYVAAEFWLAQFVSEFVTAKYNSSGVRQWISFYRRPQQNSEGTPVAIAVDSAGNTYVTGYLSTDGVSTHHPWTTLKYGPTGALLWVATMDSERVHDQPAGLVADGQGNVYVTGVSSDGGQVSSGITVKYGSIGNQLWLDSFFPGNSFVKNFGHTGIALGSDGNVYVTGSGTTQENDSNPAVTTAHVIKYSPAGPRIWTEQHRSAGASATRGAAIAVDRQGNSFVIGTSAFPSGSSFRTDYVTMKFDSAGGLAWERFFQGGIGFTQVGGIVVNASSDAYVLVMSKSPVTGSTNDITTIKYNTNGNEKWAVSYEGPAFGQDQPAGIVIRGGGIFVTGSSVGVNSGLDWATIKYVQDGTSLSPASLAFGSQAVGTTSAARAITITNVAESTLNITGIVAGGNFSQTNNCPTNLTPGSNCTIQVAFTPTTAGAKTGTVTVSSNWAGSPQVADLTGTGQ